MRFWVAMTALKVTEGEDKNDTEEHDTIVSSSKNSRSEDDDSAEDSSIESEASSDMDDDSYDMMKDDDVKDQAELELNFNLASGLLYSIRMKKFDEQIESIRVGENVEYEQKISTLQHNLEETLRVAEVRRDLEEKLIDTVYESDMLSLEQNLENDRQLLYDQMKEELEEKIRRLEEDRNNVDLQDEADNVVSQRQVQHTPTTETSNGRSGGNAAARRGLLARERRKGGASGRGESLGVSAPRERKKKKATLVAGPYIVYRLPESAVFSDVNDIKGAIKTQLQHSKKRPVSVETSRTSAASAKRPYSARYEHGRLLYDNICYKRGDKITITTDDGAPTLASITSIGSSEIVCLTRPDGSKCKLYIDKLQAGKYTIQKTLFL